MGLFDRLQNQLEDRQKEGGISPLDLASLPPRLRNIMKLMLREVEMSHPALSKAIEEMQEKDRLSPEELTEALQTLTQQGWLIRLGQDELVTYKVNLRRKAGSGLSGSIWAALDEKMGQQHKGPDTETEKKEE